MVKNNRGQGTLLFAFVVCAIGSIFVLNSVDIQKRNYDQKAKDFNQILLNEATSSAFSIMESALSRRLWEPPPDDNCLKMADFSVKGIMPDGISWKVTAKYNYTTKNFEMTSEGKYKDLKATYLKRVKVLDVSDYLLFSDSDNTMALSRLYNGKLPSTLIAKDRRIYTKGPLVMRAAIARPNPNLDWNGTPAKWPGEYGSIIQGDRIQFGGGLSYYSDQVFTPISGAGNIIDLLKDYSVPLGVPNTHRSQWGGGVTVITRDYKKATTLKQQVYDAAAGPLTKDSVKDEVYPIALFDGTPPLESWKATDNGTYFNDPDRYSVFFYGTWNSGVRRNLTCIAQSDAPTAKKECSNSEHFPKGFAAWRKNADLEGTLFTSDAEEIPAPKLNWDNMEALEEDARLCGRVIESPTNDYEDCPLWDSGYLKRYANGDTTCDRVSRIDLDTLVLNNFNVANLTNPALQERLLRRIIYSKVPTEIQQSSDKGIMTSMVAGNVARKSLSLWVVSEDVLALRGYQKDLTSPLNSDPERLREVVFNKDTTTSGVEPISLVLLSPESVHLLSPQYVPATSSYMNDFWPVVGGKIQPVVHAYTDYRRQENDGFTYGYRRYVLENASVIGNANSNVSQPFVLRGLWSGPDSSASQFPSNLCMVSQAGSVLQPVGTTNLAVTAQIPSYVTEPNSPVPPLTSRYYNGDTSQFPWAYYPAVFTVQRAAGATSEESEVITSGVRLYVKFDSTIPPGKKNLSKINRPAVNGIAGAPFSLEHKNLKWNYAWWEPLPEGSPCIKDNFVAKYTGTKTQAAVADVNAGMYGANLLDPSDDYRNIGSILGVDQPVLEVQGK